MPNLFPLRFEPTTEPASATFDFDVRILVRVVGDDGSIVLDTTEEPASLVEVLSRLSAEDLAPVIEQFAVGWLLKSRGVDLG